MKIHVLAGLTALSLLGFTASVAAAPPGNSVNYNLDVSVGFGDGPNDVWMEAHGNHPDGWPTELEVQLWIAENGEEICSYDGRAPVSLGDSSVTVDVPGCGPVVVDHQATTYRAHWNETGGQCKVSGERDESADVIVDDFGLSVSNAAFYQAVTDQCHSTGSPGNPTP
jgi:hypothetical protein